MTWQEVRRQFPEKWLLIEALQAHSEAQHRFLDQVSVVALFDDSLDAMRRYSEVHHESPDREFYVLHTSREQPDIEERRWLGIRCSALSFRH